MEEKAWKVAGIEDSFKPEKRKELTGSGERPVVQVLISLQVPVEQLAWLVLKLEQ